MNIELKYFASIRESIGVSSERLNWNSGTADELLTYLENKYGKKLKSKHLKVAVNDEYTSFDTEISDGDVVTFIPPVAGG